MDELEVGLCFTFYLTYTFLECCHIVLIFTKSADASGLKQKVSKVREVPLESIVYTPNVVVLEKRG